MNKKIALLGGLVALLMVLSWFFLLWGPSKDSYAAAKKDFSALKVQKAALQADVQSLKSIDKDALNDEVTDLERQIPVEASLDAFLHDVQNAASGAAVDLTAVSPAEPTAVTASGAAATTATTAPASTDASAQATATTSSGVGISEIKVALSASGNYEQLSAFIDALDNMDRLVVIDDVNIAQGADGTLDMKLSLRSYTTQKPKITIPSGVAAGAK